uniref:Uncharacterized protein n=1 Tax=Bursaphelenchus xylophilus TaxID=6326 RepID=A0A1I7RLT8_BURXY
MIVVCGKSLERWNRCHLEFYVVKRIVIWLLFPELNVVLYPYQRPLSHLSISIIFMNWKIGSRKKSATRNCSTPHPTALNYPLWAWRRPTKSPTNPSPQQPVPHKFLHIYIPQFESAQSTRVFVPLDWSDQQNGSGHSVATAFLSCRLRVAKMVSMPFIMLVFLLSSTSFVHSAPCSEAGLDGVNGYLLYRTEEKLVLYHQVSKGEKKKCPDKIKFPNPSRLRNFELHSFFYENNEFVVVIAEEDLGNNLTKTHFTSFSGAGCLTYDEANYLQMEGPISAMNAICTKDKKFSACRGDNGKPCSDDKDFYKNIRYVHGNCAYGPLRFLRYSSQLANCRDGLCVLDTASQKLSQRIVSKQCQKLIAVHGPTTLCRNGDELIVNAFNERVCVRKLGLNSELHYEGELVAYTLDLAAFSKKAEAVIEEVANLTASCPPYDDVKMLFTYGIHFAKYKPKLPSPASGWCTDEVEPFVKYGSMVSATIAILLTMSCCGAIIGVRVSTRMMIKEGKPLPPKPWEKKRGGQNSLMTVGVTESPSAYGTVATEATEATEIIPTSSAAPPDSGSKKRQ